MVAKYPFSEMEDVSKLSGTIDSLTKLWEKVDGSRKGTVWDLFLAAMIIVKSAAINQFSNEIIEKVN